MNQLMTLARNLSRVAPGPLLLRAIVFATGVAAFGIALPGSLVTAPMMLAGSVLAAVAAFAPGSPFVTMAMVSTLVLWFLGTALDGGGRSTTALISVACALYLQHSACALAAAVPLDAVVLPAVLLRWFTRTVGVMLLTGILGVVVVTLSQGAEPSSALVFPLLGVVGAVLAAGILAYLALRSPRRGAS
ncbi:hypothetical protein R8Z50_32870 [Longispora sp. K20-0274]|uniref:hypothetical protein n=1 Tax=Longispora sp. K20-0274 TaxID=3088255 RepID=UPI00399A1616